MVFADPDCRHVARNANGGLFIGSLNLAIAETFHDSMRTGDTDVSACRIIFLDPPVHKLSGGGEVQDPYIGSKNISCFPDLLSDYRRGILQNRIVVLLHYVSSDSIYRDILQG